MCMGRGGQTPWQEADLRTQIERYKAAGLSVYIIMIGGFTNTHLRQARPRRGDRQREAVDPRGRQGGAAGHRVQLVRAPRHGRLLRGNRKGRRGLHGVRLRQDEGPASAGARGRPHPRRDVEEHHVFPESGGAGGRAGRRAAGPASERPPGAAQPRVAADHGHASPAGSA